MRRLAEWGVGGVLADDMGLGKTVQTIAVLLDRAELGPGLVIAPTSVSLNWMREVRKFAPQLQAQLYRDSGRDSMLEGVTGVPPVCFASKSI
jgi:SNF2 family DNA or RNA helicase